ncbi:hypothetical protein Mgra_00003029 [Meloidogyne graminicola]|uniref:General transcription factor 3C polypeptide 5 n=1 Tax=Meloidogyne graminicola TaxID=189291 RepID=A0A8S9ZWJ6_9BILA|nr:hypothetical protein Mgra_00003029 [Meloidogyne graminicola]
MIGQQKNLNLVEFVLIEYPGIIKNVDSAIQTLGGLKTISSAHSSSNPIELQFRPDNLFHSSLVAERRNQGVVFSGHLNLVIRVRKRKEDKIEGNMEGKEKIPSLEIKCLGMVSTVYSFRAICDFQYLPLSNLNTDESVEEAHIRHDLVPILIPNDFLSSLSWWDRDHSANKASTSISSKLFNEAYQFLPPYQFSRYNHPSKFLLHDEGDHKSLRGNVGHGKSLRSERKALTITVNAKDPFPVAPSEEALKDVDLRCKNPEQHRLMIELFSERPLWSRVAISFRLRLHTALLKVILAKYAFYIHSGPWGRLWCRFGYDPRLDKEGRKFQSLMFIPERQRLRANTTAAGTPYGEFCDYIYRPGILPELRQMWYCLCDIQLPIAQKVCRRDYLETLKECDPVNGWLPSGQLNAIRAALKKDVALTSSKLCDSGVFAGESGGGGNDEEDDEDIYDDIDDDE